jgi:hypothetical protein
MMPQYNDPIRSSSIPWSHPASWNEVQHSIHLHLDRHRRAMESLMPLAHGIGKHLQVLARQMDMICAHTCTRCPEPCCLTASIWYDLRDLLSFHLLGKPIPVGQPISDYRDVCRFMTNTGCSLPRMIRPWICTWYLCPVQTQWLKKQPDGTRSDLMKYLDEMKTMRAELENRFAAAVC